MNELFLTFEDRPSNSPLIERVWRCHSTAGGVFHSMAEGNLEFDAGGRSRPPGDAPWCARGVGASGTA